MFARTFTSAGYVAVAIGLHLSKDYRSCILAHAYMFNVVGTDEEDKEASFDSNCVRMSMYNRRFGSLASNF